MQVDPYCFEQNAEGIWIQLRNGQDNKDEEKSLKYRRRQNEITQLYRTTGISNQSYQKCG